MSATAETFDDLWDYGTSNNRLVPMPVAVVS